MKKFSFPLGSVLTYKNQVLDSLRSEYAAIMATLHEQEAVLQSVSDRYHAYNEEFKERQRTGLAINEAVLYQSGLRALEKDIAWETKRLEEYEAQAAKKRDEVVEAKKETSSIEKLKEKKLKQYEKAVQKDEETFIDEFISTSRANERITRQ